MIKRAFLSVIFTLLFSSIFYGQGSLSGVGGGGNFSQAITTNVTYYVCAKTGPTANCAYNGDGGTGNVSNPSDSNACLTKTSPCATIAGAFALINKKLPMAIITIQLADTAGTGTDCYTPNNTTLTLPTGSGSEYIFGGTATLSGLADAYPLFYVYLVGNTTTPGNVMINGSGACNTRSVGTSNGISISGGVFRARGFVEQGYGSGAGRAFASNAISMNGGILYAEDITETGNEDNVTTAGGCGVGAYGNSILFMGGTWVSTNTCLAAVEGSRYVTTTPLSTSSFNTTITYSNVSTSGAKAGYGFVCLQCQGYVDHVSFTLYSNAAGSGSGAGTYTFWQASAGSTLMYKEWYSASQCPSSSCFNITVNAASITYGRAEEGSYVDTPCVTGSQSTCTLTSGPSVGWLIDRDSYVNEQNSTIVTASRFDNNGVINNWTGGSLPANITTKFGDDGKTNAQGQVQGFGITIVGNHNYTTGTIAAAGDPVCFTAANTVGDCPTSGAIPIGFAVDTGVSTGGANVTNIATMTGSLTLMPLEASQTFTFGYYACVSVVTAGKATTQPGPCIGVYQIGIVRNSNTSVNAQVELQIEPPTVFKCSNSSASSPITATASKTYFSLNCKIPANMLRAASLVRLSARGIYNGNATDTLTMTIDACQVSGCGSGTVVNLATTSAFTLSAVSSQYWEVDEQNLTFTIGSTGTLDTQGRAIYETAATAVTFDPTPNTGTATVNTTVDEYLSISVTFSSNSGSNSITARQFAATIQ